MASFEDFPINPAILKAVEDLGWTTPTPVQRQAIPIALEKRDIVGSAQTGTGKTAAFLIPIIDGLMDMPKVKRFRPRALILSPTRELARQVGEMFAELAKHTKLRATVVFGGEEIGRQDLEFDRGVDLLVATPGRLLEHLSRGGLKFEEIEYLVLDEADRMLDAGFLPDIRRIVSTIPERRQTMLFSATMPPEMDSLARSILTQPARIRIGTNSPRESIEEFFYPVAEHQKVDLLKVILGEAKGLEKVLVFVRTRAKARELAPVLREVTGLETAELHAELSQAERAATFDSYRSGTVRLLVATDVAARGLDIEAVTHVVNFDVPNSPDDYIHRVGRTGRVDRSGVAITLVSPREQMLSMGIEAAVRRPIQNKRQAGFLYELPTEEEVETPLQGTRPSARTFQEREPAPEGTKKRNPFTKSGQLRSEHRSAEDEVHKRRNYKKRTERRLKNMKLPHQRRRKG